MTVHLVEPESAKDLTPANPISVANNIALRQLAMSPKTRWQLEQALAKRGTSPETAMVVIDRLVELGYVDDLAYARMFVRSKTASKHLANRALKYELTKCGVSKELIEQVLSERSEDDEWSTARNLVAKKIRSMSGLSPDVITRRLLGALARKGFSSQISSAVVREALAEQAE